MLSSGNRNEALSWVGHSLLGVGKEMYIHIAEITLIEV